MQFAGKLNEFSLGDVDGVQFLDCGNMLVPLNERVALFGYFQTVPFEVGDQNGLHQFCAIY